jgi:hypothetical protein
MLMVTPVARVPDCVGMHSPHFRRGDFPCNGQPNPRPGLIGTSYNFRAPDERTYLKLGENTATVV